ncbi:hypothetical protein RTG_01200 [Rhodotorula toruloides ATCC 204091]|uniref:INO80 complex subunit F domain-containing protein n=1 Tax=Rhodotorula toruloides TaxID=5286 RepID=A0A0K3CC28_RHOTO|nr:hypothetical protein RTG_01200 [Rhodotorula toruloides ATCC 204091]KAK4331540.1 hypothetical protein RTBOTA2_001013 [Rhodotorula toruloides]PRQ77951.1 hypothetical protein AAT19DRAFT_9019 [Rhodotorula toruloides]
MPSAAAKAKAYSNPVATQADDVKYRQKYKELKAKLAEIEEDNTKLSVRILKSKKAIQRLRIERSILYDRLQGTVAPTNPYALHTVTHLSNLAASSSSAPSDPSAPPSILATPSYALADTSAPSLFLRQLDAQKFAALQHAAVPTEYGEKPLEGVVGEQQAQREHQALLAAGGAVNGHAQAGQAAGQAQGQAHGSAMHAPDAPHAAVPQAVEVSHQQAQQMAVDQQ